MAGEARTGNWQQGVVSGGQGDLGLDLDLDLKPGPWETRKASLGHTLRKFNRNSQRDTHLGCPWR